jgi:hypothetical protein
MNKGLIARLYEKQLLISMQKTSGKWVRKLDRNFKRENSKKNCLTFL